MHVLLYRQLVVVWLWCGDTSGVAISLPACQSVATGKSFCCRRSTQAACLASMHAAANSSDNHLAIALHVFCVLFVIAGCQCVQVPGYTVFLFKSMPGFQLGAVGQASIGNAMQACNGDPLCKVGVDSAALPCMSCTATPRGCHP